MWYSHVPSLGPVPVMGFEVEATPKPLKYLKGDIQNLSAVGCHGVLVLRKSGFMSQLAETRQKLEAFIASSGAHVLVWTDTKLDQILDVLEG